MNQYDVDPESYISAMTDLTRANESNTGVDIASNQAEALSATIKMLLERWADVKSSGKFVIAFSSDPQRFIDMYKKLDGGKTSLSATDAQFLLTEYQQLVDIISLARFNRTSKELQQELFGSEDDEEGY